MTQEDKELLLKELCARLPYGVMIYFHTSSEFTGSAIALNSSIYGFIEDVLNNSPYEIKEIKPYLRPMSSMTEEEKKEYKHFVAFSGNPTGSANFIDWLNKKMFDYHTDYEGKTMIEKGLALEAPEGMYK